VHEFFAAAGEFDPDLAKIDGTLPPVHGVRVGVGIGKSHSARTHAANMLVRLRKSGSARNVALAVPTHKLGAEQRAMMRELPAFKDANLRVEVWRGRNAADPDHADFVDATVPDETKAKMCRNLDAVHDAQAHGLPVQEAACQRKMKDGTGEKVVHECVHFSTCPYQGQRQKRADMWIVPHEMLFQEKPRALGELAVVVVDESPWQAALEGVSGLGDRMPLDALRGDDRRLRDTYNPEWHILQKHRGAALNALDGLVDGPIPRECVVSEGLTAANAREARKLEFERKVDPKIYPGMPRAAWIAGLKAAEGNRTILQAARFWRVIEALLADGGPTASGWGHLATEETAEGPRRVVRLRNRKDVAQGWLVPTLLIDALLAPALVHPIWPQMIMTADVQAETPHQRITQVIDRSYAKSRLDLLDEEKAARDPEEAKRRIKALREARAIVAKFARQHAPGRVLMVAQKGVREAMAAMGPMPRNIVTAHHNAVAGRDEWGDVAAQIIIGRTMPSPRSVERLASALTGREVIALPGWYPTVPKPREIVGAPTIGAETECHPDALCEAIRWEICEGELIQVLGRSRGVNRTAANPVEILVMTDVPLPLPIHEAIGYADLHPSHTDQMVAVCGFAFDNPGHAADACPALWNSRDSAKKALSREQADDPNLGTPPYKDSIIGGSPQVRQNLRRVDYQRAGRGQGDAMAWFDPLTVQDPEAALRALLGDLAWCRIAPRPQPPGPRPEGGLRIVGGRDAQGALQAPNEVLPRLNHVPRDRMPAESWPAPVHFQLAQTGPPEATSVDLRPP
jgi:putative DNA primase/helicase